MHVVRLINVGVINVKITYFDFLVRSIKLSVYFKVTYHLTKLNYLQKPVLH
jgi:hypothetical protein